MVDGMVQCAWNNGLQTSERHVQLSCAALLAGVFASSAVHLPEYPTFFPFLVNGKREFYPFGVYSQCSVPQTRKKLTPPASYWAPQWAHGVGYHSGHIVLPGCAGFLAPNLFTHRAPLHVPHRYL